MQNMPFRLRGFWTDRSGLAAVEFAMIFPIMVALYFGVVEFSSAIAVDRKATQVARTLSDLTSQSMTVADADMKSFGEAAKAIMTPYPPAPLVSSITEVYVDKVSGIARVQWSKGLVLSATGDVSLSSSAPRNPGDVVTLPPTIVVAKDTFVIWSEVSYKYTPAVGVMLAQTGMTFKDFAYTRPRLVACVLYPTAGFSDCTAPK